MPDNPSQPSPSPRPAPTALATPPAPTGQSVAPAPFHGPWQSGSLWERHWPGAGRSATPVMLAAIGAAAAVAAISLPLDRAGVGWLVTAVATTIALILVQITARRPAAGAPVPLVDRPGPRPALDRYAWAAATIALLSVGTFRSAGWLFLLCLATATLTASLALAGGHSMRSIAVGYLMAPLAAFRALPWMVSSSKRVRRPDSTTNVRILATIATSVALLTVFGALFASADAAFAEVLARITPEVNVGTTVRWIFVFGVAILAVGGAAFLRAAPPDMSELDGTEGRKVNRFEWAVPLGLLVLLFAAFVTVQLTVFFGGNRHVLETDGLTYAEYARGGFWQLSFITGLTLVVLAGAVRWAPRTLPADRLLIRVVLGALAGLTLVVVASALHRMNVYADTYGLTPLRLLVGLNEAWFGLVLLLVLVAGVRIRAPWLPRVAIGAGVLALLGFAAVNPERVIAEHNLKLDRVIDLTYLSSLSPDAVPAFTGLDAERRGCVVGPIAYRLEREPDDWRGWNLGREQARRILANDPPSLIRRCS